MRIKKLFLLTLLFISVSASAQVGFGVGYTGGTFVKGLRNLEVLTYEFNEAHPDYTNQFRWRNTFHGPNLKVHGESDDWGYEFMWSMKHSKADAEGADSPTDTVKRHQLKVKLNTLNSGIFWKLSDELRVGISYDMGMFKVLKRIGPADDFGDADWEKLYDKKGRFGNWFTLFIDLKLGGDAAVVIRPYYQAAVLPIDFSYTTSWISSTNYVFRTSNAGISLIGTLTKD